MILLLLHAHGDFIIILSLHFGDAIVVTVAVVIFVTATFINYNIRPFLRTPKVLPNSNDDSGRAAEKIRFLVGIRSTVVTFYSRDYLSPSGVVRRTRLDPYAIPFSDRSRLTSESLTDFRIWFRINVCYRNYTIWWHDVSELRTFFIENINLFSIYFAHPSKISADDHASVTLALPRVRRALDDTDFVHVRREKNTVSLCYNL